MVQNRELGELGQYLSVNTTSNVVSINAVSISVGNSSVNVSINSTSFSGTSLSANNSSYLGGTVASGYQTTAGLSANVATLTSNNSTYLNGQLAAYYTNATNISTGTLPWGQTPTGTVNTSGAFTFTGVETFNANVVFGSGISANGSFGTDGQVLHSNGTATYWAADDQGVTSVATGNGLTGGTITATGTVSALANTGIVANSTGLFVNSSYIATITANNATYAFDKSESALNVNSALTANNSSYLGGTISSGYQTTAGLSANVATLTSNSATYLGSSSSFGNTSGIFTTGIVNAASFTISNNFIANSTAITINNTAATAVRSITGHFKIVGPISDLVHAVQDGNGRYNIYWNSSGTLTYLVSNEPVTRLQMSVDATSNGGVIGFFGAPSGTANAAITSTQFFASLVGAAASTNNYIWMSPRGTSSDFYMVANGNIGIGNTTPADKLHVQGNIIASGDITSAYSDERLKIITNTITDVVNKLKTIDTFYYKPNEIAIELGIKEDEHLGISAQQISNIFPQVVRNSGIGQGYLTVQYERLVPVLIQAIKELSNELDDIKKNINNNNNK